MLHIPSINIYIGSFKLPVFVWLLYYSLFPGTQWNGLEIVLYALKGCQLKKQLGVNEWQESHTDLQLLQFVLLSAYQFIKLGNSTQRLYVKAKYYLL